MKRKILKPHKDIGEYLQPSQGPMVNLTALSPQEDKGEPQALKMGNENT